MTNAEKYLKNGVEHINEFELADELYEFLCNNYGNQKFEASGIREFFHKEVKPILTEGEKNILKSTGTRIIGGDQYGYDKNGNKVGAVPLFITRKKGKIKVCWQEAGETVYADIFGKVFKFIEERRRI